MMRRSPSLNSAILPTYCSAMLGKPPLVFRFYEDAPAGLSDSRNWRPYPPLYITTVRKQPAGRWRSAILGLHGFIAFFAGIAAPKRPRQAILLVSVPIFSIHSLTTSPALRNSPRAEPTPAGVPVSTRSPGWS